MSPKPMFSDDSRRLPEARNTQSKMKTANDGSGIASNSSMLRLKRKSALVSCLVVLLLAGNALAQSGAAAGSYAERYRTRDVGEATAASFRQASQDCNS